MDTSLIETNRPGHAQEDLSSRAVRTLTLMHRWGYAPHLKALADHLIEGSVSQADLASALGATDSIVVDRGFACLRGREYLLGPSRNRVLANQLLNSHARQLGREFARDLVTLCPFIECVALSGSVASGGFDLGDDIDFDLIVRPGTKYLSYLVATAVGLKYSLKHRTYRTSELHRTPFLPKVTCINVVWPEDQTDPFVRQDAGMAFELLHCQPLIGADVFRRVLERNDWIRNFFPQIFDRALFDSVEAAPASSAQILRSIGDRPRWRRFFESACRTVAWVLYTFVQSIRSKNPAARARIEFLRQVKYPYEVFQD